MAGLEGYFGAWPRHDLISQTKRHADVYLPNLNVEKKTSSNRVASSRGKYYGRQKIPAQFEALSWIRFRWKRYWLRLT